MAGLIGIHGPMRTEPRTPYLAVVRAVVGQQLSVKAASTIFQRLSGGEPVTPSRILNMSVDDLRAVGLSHPKARYLLAISESAAEGGLDGIGALCNEDAIDRLSSLPGVGRWTAEMVLIFALGRQDVWPLDDAGLLRAAKRLYGVGNERSFAALGGRFHPWRSHAAWYLWRSLDGV